MGVDITPTRKLSIKRLVVLSVLIILGIVVIVLFRNFNRLLSEALHKTFNSGIVSEVYELKFEDLQVNPFNGSIQVLNVVMQPREKRLHPYPYINSSFRLTTEKLALLEVEIFTLLRENRLVLERIIIIKPEIEVNLSGKRHIVLPFKDSTEAVHTDSVNNVKKLDSFDLREFQLFEAAFHVTNTDKQREFTIRNFSISLKELVVGMQPGEYSTSFDRVLLTVGSFTSTMQNDVIKHIDFRALNIGIDSLKMHLMLDTMMYRFHDFTTGVHKLDIQTADSLFHLTTNSINVSYKNKSIKLKDISFQPNVSRDMLQRKYKFQHTEFSGSVKTLEFSNVNFDSLIYAGKMFIEKISLDSVRASIFKDKMKSLDKNRFPAYLGQTVRAISLPLLIDYVKATHVHLDNTERKLDSTIAIVNITQATLELKNITNLSPNSSLMMRADAYINDKAHFKAGLTFYYSKPLFDFEGTVDKFNLPDLNPLIQAYTPAKINSGMADEISFSGIAKDRDATGTMKFLYHNLEIDLQLKEKAKWINSVIAFAANTATDSSNPPASDMPPKEVKFQIERDMNKGFINVVIKSLLNGLKETMVMSKENRKAYKKAKKDYSKKTNK